MQVATDSKLPPPPPNTNGAQQQQPQYGYVQYAGQQPNVMVVQQPPQFYSQPPQEGASTALIIVSIGKFEIVIFLKNVLLSIFNESFFCQPSVQTRSNRSFSSHTIISVQVKYEYELVVLCLLNIRICSGFDYRVFDQWYRPACARSGARRSVHQKQVRCHLRHRYRGNMYCFSDCLLDSNHSVAVT